MEFVREKENGSINVVLVSEDKFSPHLMSLADSGLIVLLVICDKDNVPSYKNSQNVKFIHFKKVGQVVARITAEVVRKLSNLKEIVVNCSVP